MEIASLTDLFRPLVIPSLVAFLLTYFITPLVIRFAWKHGFVDNPQVRQHPAHIQTRTVPRLGGVAIFLGILGSILLFLPPSKYLVGIILGSFIVVIVGALDDKYDINPYVRFFTNLLAAFLVVGSGIGIAFVTNPLSHFLPLPPYIPLDQPRILFHLFRDHSIWILSDLFAIIWIVWTMNMVNWSKGVDGQMQLIVIVAAVTIGLLSLRLVSKEPDQVIVAQLSFIIAGATLAFLRYSWYPAKIWPGYSATVLGFLLATCSILTGAKVATALLVLGIPTADAVFTVLRRVYHRKSPFWADRGHLHHRLLALGWSHPKIALFYGSLSVILGTISLFLESEQKLFAIILLSILFLGGVVWLTFSLRYSNRLDRDNG